jgi:hypothetical protein
MFGPIVQTFGKEMNPMASRFQGIPAAQKSQAIITAPAINASPDAVKGEIDR